MYSAWSDQSKLAGFPHSEISGSRVVCTSPELIAACHVLLRLHAPRHPPCALSSLTIKFAHRKLGQHNCTSTPSSSEIFSEDFLLGICLFDCQRALLQTRRSPNRPSASRASCYRQVIALRATGQNRLAKPTPRRHRRYGSHGGGEGIRTPDPMVANHVLCQLSYTPNESSFKWWAWVDSNYRPHPYQGCALTN
jgi:hypothetical protein